MQIWSRNTQKLRGQKPCESTPRLIDEICPSRIREISSIKRGVDSQGVLQRVAALEQIKNILKVRGKNLTSMTGANLYNPSSCSGPARERTHQTSSSSSLFSSLELSDTKVYEPPIRALFGTASHFYEAVVLESRTVPNCTPNHAKSLLADTKSREIIGC